MNDELGISAAAEFVQVHADPLTVGVGAEGNDPVENLEQQIDERQKQAEDSCNPNQLSEELTGLRSEEARSDEPEKRSCCVHRDRS